MFDTSNLYFIWLSKSGVVGWRKHMFGMFLLSRGITRWPWCCSCIADTNTRRTVEEITNVIDLTFCWDVYYLTFHFISYTRHGELCLIWTVFINVPSLVLVDSMVQLTLLRFFMRINIGNHYVIIQRNVIKLAKVVRFRRTVCLREMRYSYPSLVQNLKKERASKINIGKILCE